LPVASREKAVTARWTPARLRGIPGRVLVYGAAGIALLFLTLPLLALVLRALANPLTSAVSLDAISSAVWLSFATTLITLVLTIAFGTPLAYVLARHQFRFKRLVIVLVELPVVLPPAVAGLALLMAFGRRGLLGAPLADAGVTITFTAAAVVMAQTFVAAPFFVRAAITAFEGVSRDLEDAGRVDGAGGITLFRYVTLPLAFRGMFAGLMLSWARALGEFGATILFAGSLQGRTQTMPLLIYNILERDLNAAIWTGLLLVGLALLALLVSQALTRSAHDAPVAS
jgi:molybdate transport system permease protein